MCRGLSGPYGSAAAMANTVKSGDKPVLYLKIEDALPLSAAVSSGGGWWWVVAGRGAGGVGGGAG